MQRQELSMKPELAQRMGQYKLIMLSEMLEMTNEQLYTVLKNKEGKGESGKYPMFSLKKIVSAPRHIDVRVKDSIIYESSTDYIEYTNGGNGTKNTFGFLSWALKMREKLLSVAANFILQYHHDFFWGTTPLRPVTIKEAVKYINSNLEKFSLERSVDYSMFYRVLKNKTIQVEGKTYLMKFFFTMRIAHPEIVGKWLHKITEKEYTDYELVEKFYEDFGIRMARRTMAKYRGELGILPSLKRKKGVNTSN